MEAIGSGDLSLLKDLVRDVNDFPLNVGNLLSDAIICEQEEILRWLLSEGANPNHAGFISDGDNALFWAVSRDRRDFVEMLVEAGATVLGGWEFGDDETALHLAAEKGNQELVHYLLQKAEGMAALEAFDDFDRTPLHCAVRSNSLEAARILVEAGADVNALVQVKHQCRIGNPPLRYAVQEGYMEMTKLLLDHGADPDRPGWMWYSARLDLEDLVGPQREQMERLLAVPPLIQIHDSPHQAEMERQLTLDLAHHGLPHYGIAWQDAVGIGETLQVRGEPLRPFKVPLCDAQGQVVGRGSVDFVVLTVDLAFRAFWTELDSPEYRLAKLSSIPRHVWERLDGEQQSWVIRDSRNRHWRSRGSGRLRVEGIDMRTDP
ncbi:MAG: ankyrin repeat domain-containing protein [Vulcanimicrobiota bacterium]